MSEEKLGSLTITEMSKTIDKLEQDYIANLAKTFAGVTVILDQFGLAHPNSYVIVAGKKFYEKLKKKPPIIVKLPHEAEMENHAVRAWRVHKDCIVEEMSDKENYLAGWSDCITYLRSLENETKTD